MTSATALFFIVQNYEQQYSIWPSDLAIPAGWAAQGPARPKQDCLDEIERVWVDMRPASLRASMTA